ncbi:Fic family protein [Ammoniphilus oxalaticus]|uniref:Fic family protein n=1 Tax=Ammoniphilus oxalaticus TaxID=66863 RepID=UPI002482F4CA|nr:Fic family protein [Ammoniphilus oxalaticus]
MNAEQEILDEDVDPILKTAIIHAQFESIHPFLDGNGRLGRIVIVLYLIQAKVIASPIFFVSEELERERMRYYDLLNGTRGNHPDWASWLTFFLKACERMAEKLNTKLDSAEKLAINGLKECEKDSEKKVWMYTFHNPNTTASAAANALNLSANTVRAALNALTAKELLFTDRHTKRNKKYKNYELLRILS